jgi:hypothetical protein
MFHERGPSICSDYVIASWHARCSTSIVTPIKHEFSTVGQTALGVTLLGLVLIGIGGTIYKVISPDGWVAQAFGRSLSAGVAALGSLLMIAGLAWFSRGWSSPRSHNRFPELLVYTFAAAGLLYLAQIWMKGTF